MSAPLVPSPLDYVGRRRFAFYPPIRSAGPNQWFLRNSGWSEIQIVNAENGSRVWVPRQYVCGVSDGTGVQLVVELTRELALSGGVVSPLVKQVIELPRMPVAPDKKLKRRRRRQRAPVIDIRVSCEKTPRVRVMAKFALGAVAALVLSALAVLMGRL